MQAPDIRGATTKYSFTLYRGKSPALFSRYNKIIRMHDNRIFCEKIFWENWEKL
jgi:hypothetical protein